MVQRNGWTNTLAYSDATTPAAIAPRPGLLISVRNQFGRELRFTYDAAGRLAELLPPGAVSGTAPGSAASPIRYLHNEPEGLGSGVPALNQLTGVMWQDGHRRRYHYENTQFPQWLTGRTDELGVRIGTYSYDPGGRVVRSAGPNGMNVVDFAYRDGSTEVTDRSGPVPTTSVHAVQFSSGVARTTGVSAPCSQCGGTSASTAYTGTGEVARRVDHDGRVTFFTYDAKGRETERATYPATYNNATARPALNVAERVVSTRWHATWNLPTQVAEPQKVTAYTYGTGGRLTGESWTATTDATGAAKFAAVRTGSTFTLGWSYSASNLPTTIVTRETLPGTTTATETGRWTLTYNASGDVVTIKDVPRSLTGRVSQFDAHGRVRTATTIDGDAIALNYTPRGFVSSRTEVDKTSAYVQNSIGLTTEVRMPDGQVANFDYSTDHRLVAVRLNGALIAGGALRGGIPRSAVVARATELLERLLLAALRPAHAQAAPAAGRAFSSVTPAMGLPGQPSVNAAAIMMGDDRPGDSSPGGLLPRFDPATRRLAEALTSLCKCDPSGGYERPKLTALSMVHIVVSGHTAPVYRNKSYFIEPVNQALVDEVMSRSPQRTEAGSETVFYVPDMGRNVGYKRGPSGLFELTRDLTLRVHSDNCNNLLRVRNEVVTMHPGQPR